MKNKKNILFYSICILAFTLCSVKAIGQKPIDVTVNLFPPFPTNLHQYVDDFRNYTFIISNSTSSSQSIYLSVSLVGDNGVRIGFNPSFKPSEPIFLEPSQVSMVTGAELEALYGGISGGELNIEGLSLSAQISGQLPEGNYSLCVFAYDFQSGLLLSTGCSFEYTATYATVPEIIFPRNGDVLPPVESMPLNIVWSPPSQGAGSALTYEYTLKMIDLTDLQINDVEAVFLNGGIPVVLEKIVNGLNYLYDGEGDV